MLLLKFRIIINNHGDGISYMNYGKLLFYSTPSLITNGRIFVPYTSHTSHTNRLYKNVMKDR